MPATVTAVIDRAECLRLLQYESFVARLAFAFDGVVHVRPVNYLADERGVVFCTSSDTVLRAVSSGTSMVLEVDASQTLDHSGWSVIARGSAQEITDPHELEYLHRGPLKSWAVTGAGRWVRVEIDEISGVRIPAH